MPIPTLSNRGALTSHEIVAGTDWAITVYMKEDGAPVNITGRTYAAQVRTADGTLAATCTCVVVNAAQGVVSVALTNAATSALTAGTEYKFSLVETNNGVRIELIRADVTVYEGTTAA